MIDDYITAQHIIRYVKAASQDDAIKHVMMHLRIARREGAVQFVNKINDLMNSGAIELICPKGIDNDGKPYY